MEVQWHRYPKTRPQKRGDYLVLFMDGTNEKELSAEVATYLTRGDSIDSCLSHTDGSPEDKPAMLPLSYSITVAKDGFYSSDACMVRFWELKPLFWSFLPKAPVGYIY